MAKKVMVIPARQIKENKGIEKQKLRVAAYCRVSTDHEEQIGSFENQVDYYTKMISNNPDWELVEIFADEGISGTGTKKRAGFQKMMKACREKKVDLILTKSISRFARNTADCLKYSRELKDLGINVKFEKEGISTMDASGELLFTILSSLAQEESRNISENTRWGIQSRFQQGVPHISTTGFLGYDKGTDGQLVINEEQAVIVRRIFREFMEGWTVSEIAQRLRDEEIPGATGKCTWPAFTVRRMIQNEKYKGDLLMQKFYTVSYLTKEQTENDGKFDQYYVQDAHEAIIDRDVWEAAQQELERRDLFQKEHGIRDINCKNAGQFTGRVFCATCGERYTRRYWKGAREPLWRCGNTEKRNGSTCDNETVKESDLKKAMVILWNFMVENKEQMLERWSSGTTELERIRGQQMIALTAEGVLQRREVPELTRMILKEIRILGKKTFRIELLDGSIKTIQL